MLLRILDHKQLQVIEAIYLPVRSTFTAKVSKPLTDWLNNTNKRVIGLDTVLQFFLAIGPVIFGTCWRSIKLA